MNHFTPSPHSEKLLVSVWVLQMGAQAGLEEEGRGVVGRITGDVGLHAGLSKASLVDGEGSIGEETMLF